MVVGIVGSRGFTDYDLVKSLLAGIVEDTKQVVSGGAAGADLCGKRWALDNHIPYREFLPDWANTAVPGAVIKTNQYGRTYNARAGHDRNRKMADYIKSKQGVCFAFWDMQSPGTRQMVDYCREIGVPVYIIDITLTYED